MYEARCDATCLSYLGGKGQRIIVRAKQTWSAQQIPVQPLLHMEIVLPPSTKPNETATTKTLQS